MPVLWVAAEGVLTFLLRMDVDNRRSIRSDKGGVDVEAVDVGGRGISGEMDGRVAALEPGTFLLPGVIKYESASCVPSANPAAAMPSVPTAQS